MQVTCPNNITLPVDGNVGKTTVSWNRPVVSVEEGKIVTTSSYNPGDEFLVGATLVIFDVYDVSNDMLLASCSFSIGIVGKVFFYLFCFVFNCIF